MAWNYSNTRQQWEQAQILHGFLSKCEKRGSMENVLSQYVGDHISKIDFYTGVKIEFNCSNYEEIGRFYDTFSFRSARTRTCSPLSSSSSVVGTTPKPTTSLKLKSKTNLAKASHILWTYLSITYRRVILENPRKVILTFCAISAAAPSSSSSERIDISDLRDILNLGSVHEDEASMMMLDKWIQRYFKHTTCTGDDLRGLHFDLTELEDFLDLIPGLVLRFRDNIRDLLTEDNRLSLLAKKEEASISCFQKSSDKMLLQRANRRWRSLLYRCFVGWSRHTSNILDMRIQSLQIQYWKACRILKLWHVRVKSKQRYNQANVAASSLCPNRKKRRYFSMWRKVTLIRKKFRFETQSRKQVALGMSIVRGTIIRLKARKVVKIWHDEATVELRMDHARQWRLEYCKRQCFRAWLRFIDRIKVEVAQNDHRRSITDRIRRLCIDGDDGEDSNQIIEEPDDEESMRNILHQARERRKRYQSSVDEALLEVQRLERQARFKKQKETLFYDLTRRWTIEEDQRIRRTRKKVEAWLKSREGMNKVTKYAKKLERELNNPSGTSSTSSTDIALSILDSLLGHRGLLSDFFFDELDNISVDGILSRDRFERYLKDYAIPLSPHQSRDIFEGTDPRKKNSVVRVTALEKAMRNTYIAHGQESCQWKRYIDPVHNLCVLHNVIEDNKIMDFRLNKRTMKAIAWDDYISSGIVEERRKILSEKKRDFEITKQIWAVSIIQQSWRSMKRVEKTHRRIILRRKAIAAG